MSKILYAASTISHINNFHTDYIEALRAEGHEVLVMASGEGADFNIPFEKKMFSKQNWRCKKQIAEILKREAFDSVVLNTSLAAFVIRLAMPKKGRPIVLNIVHGYLFGKNTGFVKRTLLLYAEKLLRNRTDTIIVMNSEDFAIAERYKLAVRKLKMSRGMGAVVPEAGVSAAKIRRELDAQDDWLMVFVGELSGRKNQRMLISAMPKIKERIPNAKLCLIGEGGEMDSLIELAESKGVAESVIFAGRKPNPCDYIRAADLYVSASRIEGMPFNLMEALGCARPILASDIKGHTDLIDEGLTGYLYPEDDIAAFVSKAVAIKNGHLPVNEDLMLEKFAHYEKSAVFEETYTKIKEAIGL